MKVEFNLKDFEKEKIWLLRILGSLKRKNRFKRTKESDDFFVKSPALAYKYVENLISEYKGYDGDGHTTYKNTRVNRLSPELEKVFSRSPKYALKYLIITNQKRFKDAELNKKFFDKLYKSPFLSFVYSLRILHSKRIPIDKEEVFLKDYNALYQYAKQIIKGRFEEKLHNKIKMLSFSEKDKNRHDYQYLENYIMYIDEPGVGRNVSTYYGRYI